MNYLYKSNSLAAESDKTGVLDVSHDWGWVNSLAIGVMVSDG